MASATSGISKVTTGTSVRNRRENYYQTQVTTLADGSVKRETFRTDAKGNNQVKISEVTADKDGNITNDTTLSTASTEERRALQNPNSQLRNSIRQQTDEAGKEAKANSIDPGGDKATDKAGGGSGNTATDTETGDSQTADTTTTSSSTRNFGTDMRYPLTIEDGQDVITFTALTYAVKEIQGFSFGGRERVGPKGGGGRSKGTVTLPIQSGIKDQNAAGWGQDEMNPLEAMVAKSALDFVEAGPDAAGKQLQKSADQIIKDTPDFQKGIGAAVVSSATGVKGILARTKGVVVNPNLELLFEKPTLRPFSFTFKLSARSPDEAKMIVKIIRFFKQNMSPQKGGGSGGTSANLFLKAPNTFQVHYLHRGQDEHPYIGRVKECAMLTFDVDYTPDGNYSTYRDGFMTSYTISMTMKELEPVFYEDYDEFPEDQIGY
jgi:hypothetical protein